MDENVRKTVIQCYVTVNINSRINSTSSMAKIDYVLHKNDFWMQPVILFEILTEITRNLDLSGFNMARRFLDCVSSYYLLSSSINQIKTIYNTKLFFYSSTKFMKLYSKRLR